MSWMVWLVFALVAIVVVWMLLGRNDGAPGTSALPRTAPAVLVLPHVRLRDLRERLRFV